MFPISMVSITPGVKVNKNLVLLFCVLKNDKSCWQAFFTREEMLDFHYWFSEMLIVRNPKLFSSSTEVNRSVPFCWAVGCSLYTVRQDCWFLPFMNSHHCCNPTDNGNVIHKLHSSILYMLGVAVVGINHEQDGTEHTGSPICSFRVWYSSPEC